MISLKRHQTGTELLIAACDLELLGKTFSEGELRLEVSRRFFEGEKVDVRLFLEVLALTNIGNLVGKKVVGAARKAGFIHKSNVITVGGIPHAQFLRM